MGIYTETAAAEARRRPQTAGSFAYFPIRRIRLQYWITLSIIRIHHDHSPGVSRLERERSAKIHRYLDQSCSKIPFENPGKLT
jgi:hypothetical protein